MTNFYKMTFKEVEGLCTKIATNVSLLASYALPKVVLGVSRGGLTPATIISHLLDLPLVPAIYSSKKGRGSVRHYQDYLPQLTIGNILIVDDIADSGHTLAELAKHYERDDDNNFLLTAALLYKPTSIHNPDYVGREVEGGDDTWYIFPWEVDKLAK